MMASELIEKLQAIIAAEGDQEIHVINHEYCYSYPITLVEARDDACDEKYKLIGRVWELR